MQLDHNRKAVKYFRYSAVALAVEPDSREADPAPGCPPLAHVGHSAAIALVRDCPWLVELTIQHEVLALDAEHAGNHVELWRKVCLAQFPRELGQIRAIECASDLHAYSTIPTDAGIDSSRGRQGYEANSTPLCGTSQ